MYMYILNNLFLSLKNSPSRDMLEVTVYSHVDYDLKVMIISNTNSTHHNLNCMNSRLQPTSAFCTSLCPLPLKAADRVTESSSLWTVY